MPNRGEAAFADSEDRQRRVTRELFLRTVLVVRPPQAVARQLVTGMRDAYFARGTYLYRRGGEPDCMLFIVKGSVELSAPGENAWHFQAGDLVGVLDVGLERRRARDALALTDVEALTMPAEHWFETLEDNFDFAREILYMQAGSLHDMTLELAPTGGYPEPTGDGDWEACEYIEMNLIERIDAMKRCRAFRSATVQALLSLAAHVEVLQLDGGDSVFGQDQARDAVYLVTHGIVHSTRTMTPTISARFGPGDLILDIPAFGDVEVQYEAKVETPKAIVLRIGEEALVDVAEDHFDLMLSLLKAMSWMRERLMRAGASEAAALARM